MPIIRNLGYHTVNEIMQMMTLYLINKYTNCLALAYITEVFSGISHKCEREPCNAKTDLEVPLRKSA